MSTPTTPTLSPKYTLPRKMQHLVIDEKGRPVPWFVAWHDGKPEFRAMDRKKYVKAIRERLCWVCGTKLETRFAFLAGPMCGINRTSAEPPSHIECARWSAINCPFLVNPNMVRRQDEEINNAAQVHAAPGIAIMRNPGVAMVWITREYEIFNDQKGKPLIMMGRAQEVEWYCRGRAATRAEVEESIDSGIGALELYARREEGGMEALNKARRQFQKLLPARRDT
jgi:hypothetical protein